MGVSWGTRELILPKSPKALCLVRQQVLGQALADVELNLARDHVLVSQQLQLPDPAPLHHLKDDLLWELAKPEDTQLCSD